LKIYLYEIHILSKAITYMDISVSMDDDGIFWYWHFCNKKTMYI